MKGDFHLRMTGLHFWGGLLAGWLLYAVFLTGTVSYFRQEISLWMRPELPPVTGVDTTAAAVRMAGWLQENAADAARWQIVPPDARDPVGVASIWWDSGPGPRFRRVMLDGASGQPVTPRETMGGDFLYYFHFDLSMPSFWGRLIVGIAAVIMLTALVTGIVIHGRIFKDFFTFRPEKTVRAWLDAHNATAVLALPYHLMITFSGLVTLMYLYMPWGVDLAYQGNRAAYFAEAGQLVQTPPAAAPAPAASLEAMLREASRRWGGVPPGRIDIHRPNTAAARVDVAQHDATSVAYLRDRIVFDGVSGSVLRSTLDEERPAAGVRAALYGLHLARFSGPFLRWLFALSGLAGTAMVASGLILWVEKRRPKAGLPPTRGWRIARGLNVATLVGLPVAIAAFFLGNRLLPVTMGGRMETEILIFFVVWLAAFIHAALRRPDRAWREQAAAAAVLFLAIPILNAATTARGIAQSLPASDWPFLGFDIAALATGLFFAWLARRPGRSGASAPVPGQSRGATR